MATDPEIAPPDLAPSQHYLYGVFGPDGKISAHCSNRLHHDPVFVGPGADTHEAAMTLGRELHDQTPVQVADPHDPAFFSHPALFATEPTEEWVRLHPEHGWNDPAAHAASEDPAAES